MRLTEMVNMNFTLRLWWGDKRRIHVWRRSWVEIEVEENDIPEPSPSLVLFKIHKAVFLMACTSCVNTLWKMCIAKSVPLDFAREIAANVNSLCLQARRCDFKLELIS